MEKLKACPFCGRKAVFKVGYKKGRITLQIACKGCHAKSKRYYSEVSSKQYETQANFEVIKKNVMEAWNRRERENVCKNSAEKDN